MIPERNVTYGICTYSHADGRIFSEPAHDFQPIADKPLSSAVDHPPHYTSHPSGVECITVVEHMGFNVGNAIKYLWRADLKGNALEDLQKAAWYIQREIDRRTKKEPT